MNAARPSARMAAPASHGTADSGACRGLATTSSWAAIIVSSEDEAEARDAARALGGARPNHPDIAILGPAPAPLSLLRGRHRYRLLVNARRSAEVQKVIREWLGQFRFPASVRVNVDIDPYSFV